MIDDNLKKADRLLEKFKKEIKRNNRFFPHHDLYKVFDAVIKNYSKVIPQGTELYRGRINPFGVKKPFSIKEMGKPGIKIVTNNRANPPGINYLYLADDVDTVIAELRPNKDSFITIAKFETLKSINVVELSDALPSLEINDKTFSYGINLGIEFSKPIDATKNFIEYLPTQYFAEYCKSRGLDGMKYLSFVSKTLRGFNYALFYDKLMKYRKKEVRLVKRIEYKHERIPIKDKMKK